MGSLCWFVIPPVPIPDPNGLETILSGNSQWPSGWKRSLVVIGRLCHRLSLRLSEDCLKTAALCHLKFLTSLKASTSLSSSFDFRAVIQSEAKWQCAVCCHAIAVPGSPMKASFTPSLNTGWFSNTDVVLTWIFIFSHPTLSGCLYSFERHSWHIVSVCTCLYLKESVVIKTLPV